MKNDDTRLIAGALTGMFVPAAERGASPVQVGQIAMVSGVLMAARDTSGSLSWSPIVDPRDLLYPFVSHTFTNAGASGRVGPSLAQCKTAYAGASFINNLAWFDRTTTGIQVWTVPVTGYYRIRARGASRMFGLSATVTDTRPEPDAVFRLQKGDKLRIAVGQLGTYPPSVGLPISGSGGTFVESGEQGLLLVGGGAGGFAGGGSTVGVTTRLAGPSQHGRPVVTIQPQAEEGKSGIRRSFTDNNQTSTGYGGASYSDELADSLAPKSFLNGAVGGTNSDRVSTHAGGFGCGGAGGVNYNTSYNATCVGGGGGYTGGDAAGTSGAGARAGDGGCFIADFGADQNFIMTPLTSAQHGRVIVDLVG